jgi:hypothetical protein
MVTGILSLLALFLIEANCFGQEVPLSAFPPQSQQPVSEIHLYRAFLRHEAAFEHLALAAESSGKSGQAYRTHFVHKFGLTTEEQEKLASIALNFESAQAVLDQRKAAIV